MRTGSKHLQLLAGLVAGLGLLACILRIAAARAANEPPLATSASALVVLLLGAGLAALLVAIARLLDRPITDDQRMIAMLRDLNAQIGELREKTSKGFSRLSSSASTPPAVPTKPKAAGDSRVAAQATGDSGVLSAGDDEPLLPIAWGEEDLAGDDADDDAAAAGLDGHTLGTSHVAGGQSPTLQSLAQTLEDLRELYLMDPSQRTAYRNDLAQRRRQLLLDQLQAAMKTAQLDRAQDLMAMLQAQYAGDAEVESASASLRDTLAESQSMHFQAVSDQAEDFMSMGQFDQAAAVVQRHIDQHPSHAAGLALMERVRQEQSQHDDQVVDRLFLEVRHHTERRHWRKAVDSAQKLVDQFPDHRRTAKIREQLRVLKDNAQIEERKEIETRIQSLIHAQRYQEAIDLADQVIARFPGSPQAQSLITLLPKLRQTAIHAEMHLR